MGTTSLPEIPPVNLSRFEWGELHELAKIADRSARLAEKDPRMLRVAISAAALLCNKVDAIDYREAYDLLDWEREEEGEPSSAEAEADPSDPRIN